MNEPDIARDYHERDVKAAYSVLIELGQVLGAVIFGRVGGARRNDTGADSDRRFHASVRIAARHGTSKMN